MAEALQAAASSALQPPLMQGCDVLTPGEGKGKPDCKDPAPETSLAAVAPVHTSPCGPACCWTSLSLHGSPILGLPLHSLSMVCLLPCPFWHSLLKSSCAKASSRGCCLGMPGDVLWLQRWWELSGISWMNKQGQLARAGPGGIWRGTVGAVSPAALTGISDRDSPAMLPLPAEICKKSGANHVEIFTVFLPSYTIIQKSFSSSWDNQEPGLGPTATGCTWDSL